MAFINQVPAPCEVIEVNEASSGDLIFVAKVNMLPPIEWSILVGEILHHLRSVLDQLIWQLMLASGRQPDSKTEFPICESAPKLQSAKVMKYLDPVSLAVINELKPYLGGNDLLWKLHRLDITDKHRHLILGLAPALESVDVWPIFNHLFTLHNGGVAIPALQAKIRPTEHDSPLKDGSVLYRVPAAKRSSQGTTVPPNFNYEIVYGDGELFIKEPLFADLEQFLVLVDNTIKLAAELASSCKI